MPEPNDPLVLRAQTLTKDFVRITEERIDQHQAAIVSHRNAVAVALCGQEMLDDPDICRSLQSSVVIQHIDALETQARILTVGAPGPITSPTGLPAVSGVTGVSTAVMMISALDNVDLNHSPEVTARLQMIQNRYLILPAHRLAKERAARAIVRLGLATTKQSDGIAPSTHLENAWLHFEASPLPVYATSILLPMRSCIDSCIADLLTRRPRQEKTNANLTKPMSILQQCAFPNSLPETHQTLARQYTLLHEDLSRSKDQQMARERIGSHLFHSTTWLASFLEEIDLNRLRSSCKPIADG